MYGQTYLDKRLITHSQAISSIFLLCCNKGTTYFGKIFNLCPENIDLKSSHSKNKGVKKQ